MGGYITPLQALDEKISGSLDRRRKSEDELRDKQANEIEGAIKGIQARTDLTPDQKAQQINQAREQLQKLYKPHEGPHLLKRLQRIFGGGEPEQPKTGEIKPGMTIGDVLAMGSPQARAPKVITQPFKAEDGKYYVITQDEQGNMARKEVPYSEESELQKFKDAGLSDEDAEKALKIKLGVEAKPVSATKPVKYDAKTDTVTDPNTQETWSRKDAEKPDTPPAVVAMFEGAARVSKEKEDAAKRRLAERLAMQTRAFSFAISKGDHAKAQGIYDNSRVELLNARLRLNTMEDNKTAAYDGDQQAMLSLVANHIGMTLGAQKGARITRAVWDEAMESAPWLEAKIAKFFHQDANGDYIFDGWKGGVTLTKEQIDQMVGLAHNKVDGLQKFVQGIKDEFGDELSAGKTEKPGKEKKFSVPAGAPAAPKEDGHKLKLKGKVIAVSKGGEWVAPTSSQ